MLEGKRVGADGTVATDTFSDDWTPLMGFPFGYVIVFERDDAGAVTGLRVSGTGARHLRFIKMPSNTVLERGRC